MSFFFVNDIDILDLRKTVNQHGNIRAENAGYIVKAGFFAAVLNRIVKECRTDRIRVKSEGRNYLGNGYGVGNIRVTAYTELPFMKIKGICKGLLDLLNIIIFGLILIAYNVLGPYFGIIAFIGLALIMILISTFYLQDFY
jgi:hypothetical protein